jgi:cardiolipin synthase
MTSPFFDALVRATDRGVTVRLLFDYLGSKGIPGYKDMLTRLDQTRIAWHPMLPIGLRKGGLRRPDLRNHRKILVVDGAVAFMGSQNLIEPGYDKEKNHQVGREWVELTCRVIGSAVTALDSVFATDWYSETDELLTDEVVAPMAEPGGDLIAQVIPSGPGFATENNLRAFTTLLYSARRRISLTSPYFVPDESLLYAVTTAAHRGVEVELFVSEEGDQFMVYHAQCSYYGALLEAGVRIYLYPAPYVLHSKHFSIDEDVAVLGSSNMDLRSFGLNYEVSMMLQGGDVVSRMRKVEDAYRMRSRELTQEEWARRSWRSRYADNVMRLTSALQ